MSGEHDAAGLIAELPSSVALPVDFFDKQGPVGTHWEDARQFPRFYLRTAAAMEVESTLPAMPRLRQKCRVYVSDVSKVSIALLHSQQLYPGERLQLMLIDGATRTVRRGPLPAAGGELLRDRRSAREAESLNAPTSRLRAGARRAIPGSTGRLRTTAACRPGARSARGG